jgi:hypothetical protein
VRPALEVVTGTTPFMAWRGKWGASSSSPIAPRRQGKWGAPQTFNADARACTVGSSQAGATAIARRTAAAVPDPQVTVSRRGAIVSVRYRFERLDRGHASRPTTLLMSVARPGEPDVAAARRVRVDRRDGVASLRLPPGSTGPYVVSASAFTHRGARSDVARVRLG